MKYLVVRTGYLALLLAMVASLAGESVAKAHGEGFVDPKATYQTYLRAVGAADLEAALACWAYKPEDLEVMKVVVGIWIAHRRFDQVVKDRFKGEGLERLEGWIRPDLTDVALAASAKRVAGAEVVVAGNAAELVIDWSGGGGDEEFEFVYERKLIRMDGLWKLDATEFAGQEFFKKGSWGPMFRDSMAVVHDVCDQLEKGEIPTLEELKAVMDARQKKLEENYEKERLESGF